MKPKHVVSKDENHDLCKAAAEAKGWSVFDSAGVGDGFPDFIAGKWCFNVFFEVKTAKGKLRPTQKKFMNEWNGPVYVVRNPEQVVQVLDFMENEYHEIIKQLTVPF